MDVLYICLESDKYFICRLISPLETVSQERSLINGAHEYGASQQHYGRRPEEKQGLKSNTWLEIT